MAVILAKQGSYVNGYPVNAIKDLRIKEIRLSLRALDFILLANKD
jgi:hypothetical protein